MPEPSDQVSSRQRRANWLGLRTLRHVPKVVGETDGGELVYEVLSVRLMLDPSGGHFVRAAACFRCAREMAGAPVMTPLDLESPIEPVLCPDCMRQDDGPAARADAGGGQAASQRAAEVLPGAQVAAEEHAEGGTADRWERLGVMEGHLRAVTDRVNELGRVARSQQAGWKESVAREEAAARETAALRAELAAVRAELTESRALAAGVSALGDDVERLRAELARAGAGGVDLAGEVARLARQVEAHGASLARAVATSEIRVVDETTGGRVTELQRAHEDLERRLAEVVVATPAPGVRRAQEGLDARLGALAAQVDELSACMGTLADRIDGLRRERRVADAGPKPERVTANFLDELDRQLDAASQRLAGRSADPSG
ncbi:MAG: hypothetical protein ACR2NA_09055 [Solirubrobacterales bacterium]